LTLNAELEVKREVREFYDSVGWKEIADGLYQNARYEDLRPVAREYVHRCHLRVNRHLPRTGDLFLDAGSGPIQYPEYLEYARGFRYRVCLDISEVALRQARQRIGERGLFVIGDITRLPFEASAFDGLVSLHTIHHLPPGEQEGGFRELVRVLADGGRGVIVYSWGMHSVLMRLARLPIAAATSIRRMLTGEDGSNDRAPSRLGRAESDREGLLSRPGTHTAHHDYRWAKAHLGDLPGFEIRVWRSVSTAFTRALIFDPLLGRIWLRILFRLEESAPRWFGRAGQYPLIVIHKGSSGKASGEESRA
jgi:SAM-dependent methyltransferase